MRRNILDRRRDITSAIRGGERHHEVLQNILNSYKYIILINMLIYAA
jgi:hypothetical protein